MRLFPTLIKFAGLTLITLFMGVFLVYVPAANAENIEEKIEKDSRIQLLVGMPPPDIVAEDMDGNEFILSDMAGDTPVVIDFWATWCGPCRAEIPLLVEFHETYGDQVMMVGLTSEAEENLDIILDFLEACEITVADFVAHFPGVSTILDFMEEYEITYRMVHQPSREAITAYGITGIPTLVVVDIDGYIAGIHVGFSDDVIDEVLADLGIEPVDTDENEEPEDETDEDETLEDETVE